MKSKIKRNVFNIRIGTHLHIHLKKSSEPYSAIFVGMKKEEYIIITPPEQHDEIKKKLHDGCRVIIKYRRRGTVFAFKTYLTGTLTNPVDLILLAYPKQIQSFELRSFKRSQCFMPSRIFIGNDQRKVIMRDINIRGCRCIFTLANREDSLFKTNHKIELACLFPGIGKELFASGIIKNINRKHSEITIGLEFINTSPQFHQAVANYIFSVNPLSN